MNKHFVENKVVAIIGMGASGTLVLRNLADYLVANDPVEIILFTDTPKLGPGVPYDEAYNDDEFLLNMRSWLLGANQENILEFYQWIKENDIEYDEDMPYVKRSIYGKYLNHLATAAIHKLTAKFIKVTTLTTKVSDIKPSEDKYIVITEHQQHIQVNAVVLAMGHLRKQSCFNTTRFIANPYHDLAAIRAIPNFATIGILGTKLTAVDIAILLDKLGFKNIKMFSKSGLLPQSQPVHASINNQPLVFKQPNDVSLAGIFRAYVQQTNKKLSQPLLDTTKHFIDTYWAKLSRFQKKLFINKYKGWWMSHRHPMPACNAEKIQNMLNKNVLTIQNNYTSLKFAPSTEKFIVNVASDAIAVDYVIDASGTPQDVLQLDSELVRNLLQRKFLLPCEFGGVHIDCATMQVHKQKNVYCIGHLTHGCLFYVASMERLLLHAQIISNNIKIAVNSRRSQAAELVT